MKIQCDVCEKAAATLICCADEAALCAKCDIEIHAANRLASKHQRLLLQSSYSSTTINNLPLCDICREKTAFIFCVEDRALFCLDCDHPIHSANTRAANHQRFLATGVRLALTSSTSTCTSTSTSTPTSQKNTSEPPPPPPPPTTTNSLKSPLHQLSCVATPPSWSVDDLLHLSEYENSNKKDQLEFGGGLEWLTDMGLFGEQIVDEEALAAAEVPQLPVAQSGHGSVRYSMPYKKARFELPIDDDDDEEYFTVPDLG